MSDTSTEQTDGATESGEATESAESSTSTEGESTEQQAATEVRDPEKLLSAYEAEKQKRKDEASERRKLQDERDSLKAQIDGREAEHKAEQEAQRLKDEALSAANDRILKAEVRAAAAAKLADPTDALRFIDLSEFEVGSDGEVDSSQIADAIDNLMTQKPYLAAQGKRFEGSADGGARNDSGRPSQLTEADVKRLSEEGKHAEIVQAKAEGRLADYLGS